MAFGGAEACAVAVDDACAVAVDVACAVAADEDLPVAVDEARPVEAGEKRGEGVPEWPAALAEEAIAVPVCVLVDAEVGE